MVKAPVLGVVTPTVPFNAPEKLVALRTEPLHVKDAESDIRPPVDAKTMRPEVKAVLVSDVALNVVNEPVLGVVPPIAGGEAK